MLLLMILVGVCVGRFRRNKQTYGLKQMLSLLSSHVSAETFQDVLNVWGNSDSEDLVSYWAIKKAYHTQQIQFYYYTLILPAFAKIPNDISNRKSYVRITYITE